MSGHWKDRAPNPLQSDLDRHGVPHGTSLDRRWLWRLEGSLAVLATTDYLRQLQRDLSQYLHETCEHHYGVYAGDEVLAAHSQCLWCDHVVWLTDGGEPC